MWANYEAGVVIPFQKATTSIRNLNIPAYLSQVSIALPSRAEQTVFAEMSESFASVVTCLQEQTERLGTLRANLLNAIMSGEHRIPDSYDALIEGAE
jgi:hypothetical protein